MCINNLHIIISILSVKIHAYWAIVWSLTLESTLNMWGEKALYKYNWFIVLFIIIIINITISIGVGVI